VALANGFIIINVGGGPTEDKPTVTLETPADPDRVSAFLNIRGRHPVRERWQMAATRTVRPPSVSW
jgi:hypothetical protein